MLSRPITNKNNVPQMIEKVAAAKRAGAFTFQVGKMDGVVNAALGVGVAGVVLASFVGIKDLAFGTNKKEGF